MTLEEWMVEHWLPVAKTGIKPNLEFSSFSRSGLIDQLLFEGSTQSPATYAVEKAGL